MKTKIAFMGVVAAWVAFADNGVTNTFTMTTANTTYPGHLSNTLKDFLIIISAAK